MKKVLFLYSELAAYFTRCVEELARQEGLQIRIIRWAVNEEAPFEFALSNNIEVIKKDQLETIGIRRSIEAFQPDLIYLAGWLDRDYWRAIRGYKKYIPVVMGLDNPWEGTIKQRLASLLAPVLFRQKITYVWCAGPRQVEYARRLGFSYDQCRVGLYSADTKLFQAIAERTYPKRILYVGRLLEWKGIKELADAFVELTRQEHFEWELKIIGRGPLGEALPAHPRIILEDFIQPRDLVQEFNQAGIFCLPSWKEHWGVVVHEACATALPVLVSDQVGAGDSFVIDGYNGAKCPAKDKESLKDKLRMLMQLSESDLQIMGQRSYELSRQNNPAIWVQRLLSMLDKHKAD